MADQRRRGGRGRSGKGGRIPKKGDAAPGLGALHEESFVSFPLEVTAPIRVASALDEAAVEGVIRDTLRRERAQAVALTALAAGEAGPLLDVRAQVERHRDMLEQLARDLGADVSGADAADSLGDGISGVVAGHCQSKLGWITLQRAASASGDKRVERVVKPVLREKERHTEVLEALAARTAVSRLFKELD